jgi:hypothetical protein
MKKTFFYLTVICFTLSLTMSSCTKEQQALNLLYGTWRLDSQLDDDGDLIQANPDFRVESLTTFYRCNGKENEECTGTYKSTTTPTTGSATPFINAGDFTYTVFAKEQLLMAGSYYEIEEIKKKSLIIHPVNSPKASRTYSKI